MSEVVLSLPVRPGRRHHDSGRGQRLHPGLGRRSPARTRSPRTSRCSPVIAGAGGPSFPADMAAARLIRAGPSGDKQVFDVDLQAVARGEAPDVYVQNGDVIEIGATAPKLVRLRPLLLLHGRLPRRRGPLGDLMRGADRAPGRRAAVVRDGARRPRRRRGRARRLAPRARAAAEALASSRASSPIVTLGAVLNAVRTPRLYRADAMLLVEPRDPRVVDIQGIASEAVEDETRYLRTQYQVLKSRALAEQVIRDNGLRQEPLPGRPARPGRTTDWSRLDPALVDRYLGGDRRRGGPGHAPHQGDVRGDRSPRFAARMANAHVDAFVRQGSASAPRSTRPGLEFLRARLGELKERLQVSEAALERVPLAEGHPRHRREEGERRRRAARRPEQAASKAEAERLDRRGGAAHRGAAGRRGAARPREERDLPRAQVQLAMADVEHARMASQFKPNYPGVAELKRKADTIREHLAGRDRAGRRVGAGAPTAPRARRKSGCARASTSRRRRRSSRRTPPSSTRSSRARSTPTARSTRACSSA